MPLAKRISAEWAALRRADAALRRSVDTLRARGSELARLRQANADLEEARRAALNLMEDAVESRRQVEDLNQQLRQSEERLRRLNDTLEERIRERTSELAGANRALQIEVRVRRAAENEIKALFTRLVSAQEDERRRIARDVHDQLGQQMTAVRINLEGLLQGTDIDTPYAESFQRTVRLAEELDHSIDFLTWELRPAALDHLGLPAALAHLVGGWSQRFHVRADCDTVGIDGVRLQSDAEANLYRLTQEALHNVYKHARATHVSVLLERRDHQIVLVVEDNGCGFAIEDVSPEPVASLGLVSMRERAALAGGELTIESTPGFGTTITVRVPITDADGASHGLCDEAAHPDCR
jgi:signal transduction histidine kinase